MTTLTPTAESIETGTGTPVSRPHREAQPIPYRLGRDVTLLIQDDVARLLDLDRGRFYALNATGTRLLDLALRHGPDLAIRHVAREYGSTEALVRADWDRILDLLRRKGLVVASGPPGPLASPGRIGLRLLLTLAWLSLRTLGWARTVRAWRLGRAPAAGAWDEEWTPAVHRLDRAIRAAAGQHPLNTQCKERALVAWHILRNRWGLPAELVIGVLAFPFQAHAWVECGTQIVSDERIRCELFTPAARYE